jgi:hypothetical protein
LLQLGSRYGPDIELVIISVVRVRRGPFFDHIVELPEIVLNLTHLAPVVNFTKQFRFHFAQDPTRAVEGLPFSAFDV